MLSKSLFLAGTALVLLGASAGAQSQSGKIFARYNKPLKSATIDLATGTLTRGPVVNNRAATTVVDFNNNDLGGFVGVDTGGGFCEWFDAGVKGLIPNTADLMNDIVFAYCSAMLAPGSGGPGGSVKLGFYEGYTTFGGAPTTGVAAFTVTGLPGNSASSSFFGGFNCFFIGLSFDCDMIAFADGPIGYSWKFLDTGTDGTLAGTWPFLSCVTSCSGAILQVDGQGMTDVIDEYCPPGSLRASFTFGTTSGSFTSMSLDIREVDTTLPPPGIPFNATTTPNPDTLGEAFSTPGCFRWVIGQCGRLTITRGTISPPGPFIVRVRSTRIMLPNGVQAPSPYPLGAGGRILISGQLYLSLPGTHNGTTGMTPLYCVPRCLSLVNLDYAAQATVIGGGVKLSSGIYGTVGTPPCP